MKLSMENVDQLGINELLGQEMECSCGKKHYMEVDKVIIQNGAVELVADILNKYNYKKPLVICDTNTYAAAGEKVIGILEANKISHKLFVYEVERDLVPDETALGQMLVQVEKDTDVLLVVGSGVLNDLAKFISKQTKLPEILVATAPSMDGFVSNTSALTLNNLKSSVSCNLPQVIIGDVDILKKAPKRMILAGLGDMIGKYSALTDWDLSLVINNEYYCGPSAQISVKAIEKCVDSINKLGADGEFDDESIKNIMEGLIRTGIAMSYVGNSRPASGCEHHMSHYWESMFLFMGREALLHGTKVGLTSILVAKIYEWFAQEGPLDFAAAEAKIRAFDEADWQAKMHKFYQKAAPEIIANAKKDRRNDVEQRLQRLAFIKEHFAEVMAVVKSAQSFSLVENIMSKAGAPLRPQDVGIEKEIVHNSILVAHEVRQRYTILNMLNDLGLLEKYAGLVDDFIGNDRG